ncbi:hypothetical protein [Trinickia dinghuensis]|uniref:Uncharacterized protein n=1 Tax=Trinickia dinghuensis TaxID=2291023 RepID=A0A3D8JXY3_9BURK|nr:hypothetical protein [Trinickia dinghuensis]RDU98023.1 hypothetical protein DWV00_15985 [Trinickia dinghuensis]
MTEHPERKCVVVMWSEEKQALISYTLEVDRALAVTQRLFPLELPLADYGNQLDDEFARRFGGATLNLLALSNPELKPHLKFTPTED